MFQTPTSQHLVYQKYSAAFTFNGCKLTERKARPELGSRFWGFFFSYHFHSRQFVYISKGAKRRKPFFPESSDERERAKRERMHFVEGRDVPKLLENISWKRAMCRRGTSERGAERNFPLVTIRFP